jgi:hypothetical protein
MGDMNRAEVIAFIGPEDGADVEIRLLSCGYGIAHPHRGFAFTNEGSADDYFINNELNVFGVADGVGDWEHYGVDPQHFPKELMIHCQEALANKMPLRNALEYAHE